MRPKAQKHPDATVAHAVAHAGLRVSVAVLLALTELAKPVESPGLSVVTQTHGAPCRRSMERRRAEGGGTSGSRSMPLPSGHPIPQPRHLCRAAEPSRCFKRCLGPWCARGRAAPHAQNRSWCTCAAARRQQLSGRARRGPAAAARARGCCCFLGYRQRASGRARPSYICGAGLRRRAAGSSAAESTRVGGRGT